MLVLEKFRKKINVEETFNYIKEMENNFDSSFVRKANLFLKKVDDSWDFFGIYREWLAFILKN